VTAASEYLHVEQPFLTQLAALGWTALDQGAGTIPSDPARSLRSSFREWLLPEVFRSAVRAINSTEAGGEDAAKRAFEKFYAEKGLERIRNRVAYFAPKAGVVPSAIDVKEIGYRWASCASDGRLSFHWKCMMAAPKVIDYIVVHELCHMRHRDHTDAFWNEVDKVMPDYYERKAWLRENGASFDL